MNIEVIVRVQEGNKTYDHSATIEVRESETVAPDRKAKRGDDDYGRPVPDHPWERAHLVLSHLSSRATGRARQKLLELQETEAADVAVRQAAWDEQKKATGEAPPAPLEF
jgi:hypothetical protein